MDSPDIDQDISALMEAGASDEEIAQILQAPKTPDAPPSQLREFASGLISPITGAIQAVTHPIETGRALVANINRSVAPDAMEQMAAEPRQSLGRNLGVATSVLLGPGALRGAVKNAPPVARATLRGTNAAIEKGAEFIENNPAVAVGGGALIGYAEGGIPGALIGAAGGGPVARILKHFHKIAKAEEVGPATTSPVTPASTPAPVLGPAPKPRWSTSDVAEMGRKAVGSEKAGRMLYGNSKAGNVIGPAERKAAIVRQAPGSSKLPDTNRAAIIKKMESMSFQEAYDYAMRAPSPVAQEFFAELLKRQ